MASETYAISMLPAAPAMNGGEVIALVTPEGGLTGAAPGSASANGVLAAVPSVTGTATYGGNAGGVAAGSASAGGPAAAAGAAPAAGPSQIPKEMGEMIREYLRLDDYCLDTRAEMREAKEKATELKERIIAFLVESEISSLKVRGKSEVLQVTRKQRKMRADKEKISTVVAGLIRNGERNPQKFVEAINGAGGMQTVNKLIRLTAEGKSVAMKIRQAHKHERS